MLPPGHVAAGFLTAKALLHFLNPSISPVEETHLIWWGVFFSFAPDLDMFYSFAKEKAFAVRNPLANNHRKLISHAPILWLLAGLGIYFFAQSPYFKTFGLILWACSWSHFVLDSIEYGIMWLWPFNKRNWALKDAGVDGKIEGENSFKFWLNFLNFYRTLWTFYAEIIVLIIWSIYFIRF